MTTLMTLDDVLKATGNGSVEQLAATEQDFAYLMMAFLALPEFGSFPITAWQDFSVPKALIQSDAHELADLCKTIYNAIRGGILDLCANTDGTTNPWLDLWGQSQYQEARNPAKQEVWTCWVTNSSGGPVNLDASELIVGTDFSEDQQYTPVVASTDADGNVIYVPTSVAIAAGVVNQQVLVQATAATPGSMGVTGPGTITRIVQPDVPGLSVTNWNPDGSGSGELVIGTDIESDPAYLLRLKGKWPARSLLRGNTHAAWDYWVSVVPGITLNRWRVVDADDPGGVGGQVTVYADLGSADLATLDTWLQSHRPLTCRVFAQATVTSSILIGGQVSVPAAWMDTVRANWTARLTAYQQLVRVGSVVRVYHLASMLETLPNVDHVEGITLAGAGDYSLPFNGVPLFDQSGLSWVTV